MFRIRIWVKCTTTSRFTTGQRCPSTLKTVQRPTGFVFLVFTLATHWCQPSFITPSGWRRTWKSLYRIFRENQANLFEESSPDFFFLLFFFFHAECIDLHAVFNVFKWVAAHLSCRSRAFLVCERKIERAGERQGGRRQGGRNGGTGKRCKCIGMRKGSRTCSLFCALFLLYCFKHHVM